VQEQISVRRTRYPAAFASEWHSSEEAQLIYPSSGVMRLRTRAGTWIVPPLRACWLPAFEQHQVECRGVLEMHSVYCRDAILSRLPHTSGIVEVPALLREIILALEASPSAGRRNLEAVFVDLILLKDVPRLFTPSFSSPHLVRIQTALAEDPADGRSLSDWSRELNTSTRTLARLFRKEAGIGFSDFRVQMRLHAALDRLAQGASVTSAACDAGFSSASSFIAMFRRATGVTPRAYFRD